MQDEALAIVPRRDRPSPDDLVDYQSIYTEGDPDYNDVRPQLNAWLYDYRRKQDEARGNEDGRTPYEDAELFAGGRSGYDPERFGDITNAIQRGSPTRPHR